MICFAVVTRADAVPYFDGHNYAKLPDGRILRSLDDTYVVLATYGSALGDRARDEAASVPGGFVVESQSEYWPGGADILEAIERGASATGS